MQHAFVELDNYGIPTGYWVCKNLECSYSTLGTWVWYEQLPTIDQTCPVKMSDEEMAKWNTTG